MTDKGEKAPLAKPKFVKVADLEQGRSGYNVYVKVVEAKEVTSEIKDGPKIPMIDAIVGDETGTVRAFFKGQHANGIKVGATIALRNGVKRIIRGHIHLEINLFGRVTPQTLSIKPNTQKNISDLEIKFEPRPYYRREGPSYRREGPRRQYNNQYDQRRGGGRRFEGRRGDRRDDRRDNRRDEREDYRKEYNRDYKRDEREDERRDERRDQRRDYRRDRRDHDYDYDRGDRDYDRRQRKDDYRQREREDYRNRGRDERPKGYQERTYQERSYQQKRGERRPMQKIKQIQPGTSNISFIAKVISAQLVKGANRTSIRCVLGDETGIVNAFLPENSLLAQGLTVALFNADAAVVKQHIEIQRGRVEPAKNSISKVNNQFNLSEKSWVEVD